MNEFFLLQVVLKPLRNKTAHEVARALLEVSADMGLCSIHITDQGTEFVNKLLDGKTNRKDVLFHAACKTVRLIDSLLSFSIFHLKGKTQTDQRRRRMLLPKNRRPSLQTT